MTKTIKFLDGSEKTFLSLSGANLSGANLYGANLRGASLVGASLSGANLSGANLSGANLSGASLVGASLSGANLSGANLYGANLRGASLVGASLSGANLSGANLSGANLSGASLVGASLSGATLPAFQICPEVGSFIAWKKTSTGVIKIRIPKNAKRTSNLIGRKCRASEVKVIGGPGTGGRSQHDYKTSYLRGATVIADEYNDDPRIDCTHGIHFFMTKAEAEAY